MDAFDEVSFSLQKNEVMEGFENLDFNLMEATLASIQTQSLTPIIKEELRLKIQSNRLALGKQELPKPIFKEPEKFQVNYLAADDFNAHLSSKVLF